MYHTNTYYTCNNKVKYFVMLLPFQSPSPTERTGPFCDDNPSNNPAPTAKHRDHNAHNILPLTIYRHKMKNANPKKKSTG